LQADVGETSGRCVGAALQQGLNRLVGQLADVMALPISAQGVSLRGVIDPLEIDV
jgi:hypothetical protein